MASTPPALPEIKFSSYNFTVGHWLADDVHGKFDLDAPYQRGSVWTVEQRRLLVKSLVMGLPIGAVVTSVMPVRCKFSYRVVDGKQRIEAVRAFVNDEFTVPGWWWTDDSLTNRDRDVRFSDLHVRGQRMFGMSRALPALEFDGRTEWVGRDPAGKWISRPRNEAQILRAEAELFLLLNGGGVAQTDDDMARAAAVAEG